ncbi:MAG: hypothetical protein JNM68_11030 [Dinghuibacter sp.]|nr:hypothetical protein [Dinghuibacter sp.]
MHNIIQPEVIVGLGERTEYAETAPPFKTVKHLHIHLEDWLGDDLMECHPCYIVTEKLKLALLQSAFTGFVIEDMEQDTSEYFFDNYRLAKELPLFYRLVVNGEPGKHDLYVGDGAKLYASKAFISFLEKDFSVKYMEINPERNEFDDLLDKMIAESKKGK